MRSIIVYCSKTGNTEKVAHAILDGVQGQADIIKLELTHSGLLKDFQSAFTFDFSDYDTIFLGGWVMMMSVHPFLSSYINSCGSFEGKKVVCFITGAAIFSKGHVYRDLKKLVEAKGGYLPIEHFLYVTTLFGPLLTKNKLKKAVAFARGFFYIPK
ncbi:MAG: hypothetical protein L3V56_09355 [Candidatus Magnetoovum sp. WYHC-5]|nr:hypothetical protein [Candidatus Magnetoovum sp. WYHC-5]